MLLLKKVKRQKKVYKYKKEAQIDPNKEYLKVINVKDNTFTFKMKGRTILNESEFNRFVKKMDNYIRPFVASNFRKIPGMEFEVLYNESVYRLWRCIATFDNEETARVKNRASFLTYFTSILRKDFENKRVTYSKSKTIERLKKKGKTLEARAVEGLIYAIPLSVLEMWQVDLLAVTEIEERYNEDEQKYELTYIPKISNSFYKVKREIFPKEVIG